MFRKIIHYSSILNQTKERPIQIGKQSSLKAFRYIRGLHDVLIESRGEGLEVFTFEFLFQLVDVVALADVFIRRGRLGLRENESRCS